MEILNRSVAVEAITHDMDLIEIREGILAGAEKPFAAPLKTLDAIHLATAIAWRHQNNLADLAFATHDDKLARAARAAGFEVLGA